MTRIPVHTVESGPEGSRDARTWTSSRPRRSDVRGLPADVLVRVGA